MTATETQVLKVSPPSPNGNGKNHAGSGGSTPARVPPQNLDAERSFLGAIILSPKALNETVPLVEPEDFYRPAHGHLYAAIQDLASRSEPVDSTTLAETLQRRSLFETVGGHPAIAELIDQTPSTSNAERYARIVAQKATLRRLIAAGGEIIEMGYEMREDVEIIQDLAEQKLYEVNDRRRSVNHAVKLGDALPGWLDTVEARAASDGLTGTASGLIELDEKLTGFRPGQLIVICARPAMGKSALGGQFAFHVAHELRLPALLSSIEMSMDELLDRIVAAHARVSNQRIRTGRLRDNDWPRISDAIGTAADIPLYLHDAPGATLAMLRSEVRRVTAVAGTLALVVVDYLQLLTSTAKAENRQVEVAEISAGLKRMARELEVPVIALAQLNRNLENRADKRPTLADLRESGAIENDADVVIGIYRDDYYRPDSNDRGVAELIILKQRNGPVGLVQVAWLDQYGVFANMARV